MFYYVPIPIYNGFLMLGYSTMFTNLPVLSLVNYNFFFFNSFLDI